MKFYVLLSVLMLSVSGLTKFLLVSDGLYFNFLAEQLSNDHIEAIIAESKRWEWLNYLFVPVFYFLKCGLVALCLGVAHFFVRGSFEIKKYFTLAAQAELVFIIPVFIKIGWFLFVRTDYTFLDLQNFYPLSILQIFDTTNLAKWLLYPLQICNLFELAYWFLLAQGISQTMGSNLTNGIKIVLSSYVLALLVWVVFIMFLSVTMGS